MSSEFKKKTVIVTGAASGIGAACAKGLAADGHNVCALDISPIDLDNIAPNGTASVIEAITDVSDPDACTRAVALTVEKFGRLDGLVHMAAAHSTETASELTADIFNRIMRVNVTGSFLIADAAANQMAKTGGGAIVLATSGVVLSGGVGGHGRGGPAYTASKSAIHGLTRSLAKSYGSMGVRVNSVAPGATETAMTADYDETARRGVADRTIVGRMGNPRDRSSGHVPYLGCSRLHHR